jgi:hypothetical protein
MDKNKDLNLDFQRLILTFLIFTLFYILFSSMLNMSTMLSTCSIRQRQRRYLRGPNCGMCNVEYFTNSDNTFDNKYYSIFGNTNMHKYYQYAALTAPSTHENTPSSILFGEFKKFNLMRNSNLTTLINITANLYILDGNVYTNGQRSITQSYKAYFTNDKNERLLIGDLIRDGDGLYKLQFMTTDNKYNDYKEIVIIHQFNGDEKIVLSGKLRS